MTAGKIVLVTKLKGGSGATTTCRELAVAAVMDGLKVGLVDLDAQGGLTRWWSRRTKGANPAAVNPALLELPPEKIRGAAKGLRSRYDLVVVDSPPTVHATIQHVAGAADLALIPCRPTTDDMDAVGPIARLLRGVVDMGFILTQVPGGRRSRDGAEALERLAGLAPVLGRTSFRLDYPRPAAGGRAGYEEGGACREEIGDLWRTVRERLNISGQSRDDITTSSRSDAITAA